MKDDRKVKTLLEQHHAEMARASAAAMERHYEETIEICSELLTSGIYEQLSALGDPDSQANSANAEFARRCRAEARLLMATAMHYADGHHDDIVRVLTFALDAAPEIQKDVLFTLGVVHLSFGQTHEAGLAMQRALDLITTLKEQSQPTEELAVQEREAREFLNGLSEAFKSN